MSTFVFSSFPFSEKQEKSAADQPDDEEANTEQMVTFPNGEAVSHTSENGHYHVHHHHHEHSEVEHFYENTTSEVNEYSEYCVPNCEPIENN